MTVTTGLSGNEIYCLAEKGYEPGNIVVGNSVHSLGIIGSIGSGMKAMLGGEIKQVTTLIEEGRETAYRRMLQEAKEQGATGITGVTSELVFHGSNIEFLSIGSAIHAAGNASKDKFSTSDNGQQLYAQLDVGFRPICFSFGNSAYSMGVGRGLIGGIKSLARGEIKEYSSIFNTTRHLALTRIVNHAAQYKANAVLGITTTIIPFGGLNEMLMIGTASHHPGLPAEFTEMPATSNLTNIELWNMAKLGYMPQRLLLGTSVYALGVVGGITSLIKSFKRGEINELTRLIYEARENALNIINTEANAIGADDIVGVKTYVYDLGNGLIEFLAIGTAVKRTSVLKTQSEQILPQAIIANKDTYFDTNRAGDLKVNVNTGSKPINSGSFLLMIIIALIIFSHIFVRFFT
ncbi:heavy metal-binding domain-containing protein [Legionella sp. W05-934-2]|jgi:uncharacterized protein YbjQ (UPF0145 family)|uniref:heavy metal-binding domain-containing protein n=1 Tax=Legionella sp. W05-934-2 TaxID=1198649 RepID=UPI0034621308